ncbi:uncharacterized protein LOC134660380 [Cydia amplana]|uniref:uncharacterized protein LOC134660380 n=1 Tax=Cydia amplana TaxID=1869771 RepID=UPI002FE5A279
MLISYLVLLLPCLGSSKQQGWLDRMVACHKKNFLQEFANIPPLTVTVEKAPPGFVDSPKWDRDSVMRLVMLVEVLDARQARQAIRRALSPSRRQFDLPPGKNSFDLFPSWSKDHPNHFYYDDMVHYDDKMTNAPQDDKVTDDTVVYISNPVEARLPASMVTVRLLREIMEMRAIGLREMPPSPRSTYTWSKKSQNPEDFARKTTAAGGADTTAAGDATPPKDGEGNETEKPAEGEQKEEKKEEEKKEK